MSSWFDKLLEDLQRRQEEADARREGRPFERRERNVTPLDDAERSVVRSALERLELPVVA